MKRHFQTAQPMRRNHRQQRPLVDSEFERRHSDATPRSRSPVTVCIAAICQGPGDLPYIIGATDRKVTFGDIEYEPDAPMKVWDLGSGNAALMAGELDAQAEICGQTWLKRPQSVKEAVSAYSKSLAEYNLRHSERGVLAQYGLTMKTFLESQNELSPELFHQLNTGIKQQKAEIETIICGVDRYGPQIFLVDHTGRDYCHTPIGFVAIGDGGRHASSHFMFARYSPRWPLARALHLLYTAKKRAEAAPGVGEDTDLFFIGYPGKPTQFSDEMMGYLKLGYEHVRDQNKHNVEVVNVTLEQYVEEMLDRVNSPSVSERPAAPPEPQSAPPNDSHDEPPNPT
jgi:hypothetical protein